MFCQSYAERNFKNALTFPQNYYLCQSTDNNFKAIENNLTGYKYTINTIKTSYDKYAVNNLRTYNNTKITCSVNFIGISEKINNNIIYTYFDNFDRIYKGSLLYGREFSKEDILSNTQVVIITKSLAKILFYKEDAIGETISVSANGKYLSLKVIGVVNDYSNINQYNLSFNKILNANESEANYSSSVYIPIYLFNSIYNDVSTQEIRVYSFANSDKDMGAQIFKNTDTNNIVYISQDTLINQVVKNMSEIESIIQIILSILFVFTGFILMFIMFFSIKERVTEIGIRRSLGASKTDIVIQFIFESIIICLISWVISIIVSLIFCNILSLIFIRILYIDIIFIISHKIILSSFLLMLIQGIIFSSIPAMYTGIIRPSEAIHWD